MTTTADILALHDRICKAGRDLVVVKNHDYGAGGEDAFANFRSALAVGVKPEIALLVRVLDKISRLRTFLDKGALLVQDEKFEDTIIDIINYMVLLLGMIQERKAEDKALMTGTTWIAQVPPPVTGLLKRHESA